jgi:ParB/RepB/Spo0J family partition protein
MPQIVSKPLGWFKPDPNQPRKSFPEAELRELGESMLAIGQQTPGQAQADGIIIDMERRVRAAQLVGITHLDVIITDRLLTRQEVLLIQVSSAHHRKPLMPPEMMDALARLSETMQQKDICQRLRIDAGMCSGYLTLHRQGIPALIEAFRGGLAATTAMRISRLSPEEQHAELDKARNGATRDEVRAKKSKPRKSSGKRMSRAAIPLPGGESVIVIGKNLDVEGVRRILGLANAAAANAPYEELKDTLNHLAAEARKKG